MDEPLVLSSRGDELGFRTTANTTGATRHRQMQRNFSPSSKAEPMAMQLERPPFYSLTTHTQASYNPNYSCVERSLAKGKHSMELSLSRANLP